MIDAWRTHIFIALPRHKPASPSAKQSVSAAGGVLRTGRTCSTEHYHHKFLPPHNCHCRQVLPRVVGRTQITIIVIYRSAWPIRCRCRRSNAHARIKMWILRKQVTRRNDRVAMIYNPCSLPRHPSVRFQRIDSSLRETSPGALCAAGIPRGVASKKYNEGRF